MNIHTATIIYFSPTGSTKKIVQAVIRGMKIAIKQQIDITLPEVRNETPPSIEGEITLIGIPVYGMGVPKILNLFLTRLRGNGKPAILIAVYGNVDEGTALNELSWTAIHSGFKLAGAASFIGEHTLSTDETPIAKGRPDNEDIKNAEEFGRRITEKLQKANDLDNFSIGIPQGGITVLGRFLARVRKIVPRNDGTKTFSYTPVVDVKLCNHCGICIKHCPMGAIDRKTLEINERQCFHCFSCAKRCPQNARKIVYRPKYLVKKVMTAKTKVKNEPNIFL